MGAIAWANTLQILGLVITVIGAFIAARSVFLSENEALEIGVARYSGTREDDLKLPAVRTLLRQGIAAKRGFLAVALGAVLQIAATVMVWSNS